MYECVMQNVRSYLMLQARQVKIISSLLALVLYLVVQAFAASPSLHHFIHHDADQADHQCAVTLLSHGQVALTPTEVSVPVPIRLLGELTLPTVPVLGTVEYRLLPERAPPSHLS